MFEYWPSIRLSYFNPTTNLTINKKERDTGDPYCIDISNKKDINKISKSSIKNFNRCFMLCNWILLYFFTTSLIYVYLYQWLDVQIN